MQRRSTWMVAGFGVLTAGAYVVAWLCQTREELNLLGARIPSPWWLVSPVTGLAWLWAWAQGVRLVTAGRITAPRAAACVLLGPFGIAHIQAVFNALADAGRPPSARWYRPARSRAPSRGM